MLDSFANGSWLTWQRMRAVAVASGAISLLLLVYLFVTASGTVDVYGRPLGTDFSNVWTAGRMALDGQAVAAWDWESHHAIQKATHQRQDIPFYGWHYPPPFLLVAALLAQLSYIPALLIWQFATLAMVAVLLVRIVPGWRSLFLGVTAPVVFVCLGHGHNGFLTAALLGGGFYLLDKRPFVAGLLLGCLLYKPQFALVIGPLLLVTLNWRAMAGAALSAAALIVATLAIWGWPVWDAFLGSLPLTRHVIIENGVTGWQKIQSPFAMIRMWGGSLASAYAVQAVATIVSIGAAVWAARRRRAEARNAAATAAAMLSTPYVLDYDHVVLAIGVAFLVSDGLKRGFLTYEKSLLALVWITPLFARQLTALSLLPFGQMAAITILALAIRRAVQLDRQCRANAIPAT
jgi:hypothetical protein